MEFREFLEENISWPLFILSTLIFLLFIIKLTRMFFSDNIKNLPPGPPKLPIIGNLHQLGNKPHVSTAKLSQKYGPLISLRLGSQVLVVANSPEAAMGILKTQDRHLSSRVVPTALQHESVLPYSILFSEANEKWRTLKTLCREGMFSPNALEAHSRFREEKMDQLLEFLHRKQGQVINTHDIIYTTFFNIMSCIVFDKDFLDLEEEHETFAGVRKSFLMVSKTAGRIDVGSFFPVFQRFDLQGIRKEGIKYLQEVYDFWEDLIEDRRAHMNSSTRMSEQANSFLDRLLLNGFSNDQINEYVLELFAGGANTTTTAITGALVEIVKNKDVMAKIEEELKREINSDKIRVSQLSKLPYLQACVKEALRLHPPLPFLLPRVAVETCEVMNYTIPKNASIFVNVWAIGRDPKIWDDPLSFKPERYLGSNLDFKEQDFKLLPFGSGRRMCPSVPLGSKNLELIIASLIHEFNWVLPKDEDPTKLHMDDKPLKLIFKSK